MVVDDDDLSIDWYARFDGKGNKAWPLIVLLVVLLLVFVLKSTPDGIMIMLFILFFCLG